MEKTIFIAVLVILVAGFVLNRILEYLNSRTWSEKVPDDLTEFYSEEEYQKAKNYNREKDTISMIAEVFSFLVMISFLLLGGFGWLNDTLGQYISNDILLALAFFGVLFFASDLLGLPISIYNTFVIEAKYGFNKTTPKTFVLDKFKSYLLAIILGGGIMALLLWIILSLGSTFWIVAFAVVMVISFFLNMFYASLIVPLFNKLKPLEEGDLRTAIESYAEKVNFPLNNIFVIDGSKRSSKANAYFTGLWKKKKIVLYDTLIEKHSNEELLAVLAHEVGHYKRKHIVKGLLLSGIQTFVMFYILSLFIFNEDFTGAFYYDVFTNNFNYTGDAVLHINLIAFAILYEPVSLLIGLAGNVLSRKHEYQADRFAVETTGGVHLARALKKMSTDHLSNLKPHPSYVFFYYSHPPMVKRLKAIYQTAKSKQQNRT